MSDGGGKGEIRPVIELTSDQWRPSLMAQMIKEGKSRGKERQFVGTK